tara:strand:+ start:1928 stop:2290 length:363 start_codon:yes stop_codon:yes gene_type:complete
MKKMTIAFVISLFVLSLSTNVFAGGAGGGSCPSKGEHDQIKALDHFNKEYAKFVNLFLTDGNITKSEREVLNQEQKTLNLTKEEADEIEKKMRASLLQKKNNEPLNIEATLVSLPATQTK